MPYPALAPINPAPRTCISRIAVARRLCTMLEAWCVESMMRWVVSAEMSRVPAEEAQLRE